MITFQEFVEGLQPIEKDLITLYERLLKQAKPQSVLEVGSGWGIFSRCVMEYTAAKVTTLDKIAGYGLALFEKHCTGFEDRIERIVEDSHVLLPRMEGQWNKAFDFVFVDGDHGQEGAAKDITFSWPMLKPGGLLMIDDVFHKCNWDLYDDKTTGRQEFNFGVTRAVWGFISAHREEFAADPVIHPYAHGVLTVQKKEI